MRFSPAKLRQAHLAFTCEPFLFSMILNSLQLYDIAIRQQWCNGRIPAMYQIQIIRISLAVRSKEHPVVRMLDNPSPLQTHTVGNRILVILCLCVCVVGQLTIESASIRAHLDTVLARSICPDLAYIRCSVVHMVTG